MKKPHEIIKYSDNTYEYRARDGGNAKKIFLIIGLLVCVICFLLAYIFISGGRSSPPAGGGISTPTGRSPSPSDSVSSAPLPDVSPSPSDVESPSPSDSISLSPSDSLSSSLSPDVSPSPSDFDSPAPSPIESPSPTPVSYSKGYVFYYEDFSQVEAGYLPKGWIGGEKLMVKEERGKKFLTPFEYQGKQSIVIPNIKYPKNYEIRVIANFGDDTDWYVFSTGSCSFGIGRESAWINNTKKRIENVRDKTFTSVFKKKDQLLSLQVDGNEEILVRDPSFKYSDTFSVVIDDARTDDPKIYEIKMTDRGE